MSAQHSPEHPPRSDQPTRRDLLIGGAAAAVAAVAAGATHSAAAAGTGQPVAVASKNGLAAVRRAVEQMAAGVAPVEAAVEGVGAVNRARETGGAAMWSGGSYAVCRSGSEPELVECAFLYAKT